MGKVWSVKIDITCSKGARSAGHAQVQWRYGLIVRMLSDNSEGKEKWVRVIALVRHEITL